MCFSNSYKSFSSSSTNSTAFFSSTYNDTFNEGWKDITAALDGLEKAALDNTCKNFGDTQVLTGGAWGSSLLMTSFRTHLNETIKEYQQCLERNQVPFSEANTVPPYIQNYWDPKVAILSFPDVFRNDTVRNDTRGRQISYGCTIAAVADIATPGLKLTILVKRSSG